VRRREFMTLLAACATAPSVAGAQSSGNSIIGFLHSASPGPFASALGAYRLGLRETGFIEGANVSIEYRWAEGEYDRLPALAADLVGRHVAVIAAIAGNAPAKAAKAATTTIPIVFVSGGDPVAAGLVASLNRPGGNVTGISWVATALVPKQLDLLRWLTPSASAIGALLNPNYSDHSLQLVELQQAGAAIGKGVQVVLARTAQDIETAFASLRQERIGSLIVANDPFFVSRRHEIVELAARHKIPAMYFSREFTVAGGLMSYGADLVDAARRGGIYTGKILQGAKPADLPVEQASKFELVINLAAAKALGITLPPTLLTRADELIE
jgi:putative tryptophan/tyrosine transport system substrate-binding protein